MKKNQAARKINMARATGVIHQSDHVEKDYLDAALLHPCHRMCATQ